MGRHKQAPPFAEAQLAAPATLSPRAREIFEHTVAAVDPFHFSQVDLSLLAQFCGACETAEIAQKEIDERGAVIDMKTSPWIGVLEKSTRSCVALSARLRICPQSRYDRLVAGTNARAQYAGKKLWEGDYDPEDPAGLLAKPTRPKRTLAYFREPAQARPPHPDDDDELLA